jgi:hypothetical protein
MQQQGPASRGRIAGISLRRRLWLALSSVEQVAARRHGRLHLLEIVTGPPGGGAPAGSAQAPVLPADEAGLERRRA